MSILFPKMKGLWIICDILKKNNRLGNIIDFTITVEKKYKKFSILNEIGDTQVIINSYNRIYYFFLFANWFHMRQI